MKKTTHNNSYLYSIVIIALALFAYYYFSNQKETSFSQAAGGVVSPGVGALDALFNNYNLGSYVPPADQQNFSDFNQFVRNNQLNVGNQVGVAGYRREISYAEALQKISAQARFMNEVLLRAGVKVDDLLPTASTGRLAPKIVERADRSRCSFDAAQQVIITQFDNCVANLLSAAISPPGLGSASRDDVRLACAISQSLPLNTLDNIIASRCQ